MQPTYPPSLRLQVEQASSSEALQRALERETELEAQVALTRSHAQARALALEAVQGQAVASGGALEELEGRLEQERLVAKSEFGSLVRELRAAEGLMQQAEEERGVRASSQVHLHHSLEEVSSRAREAEATLLELQTRHAVLQETSRSGGQIHTQLLNAMSEQNRGSGARIAAVTSVLASELSDADATLRRTHDGEADQLRRTADDRAALDGTR